MTIRLLFWLVERLTDPFPETIPDMFAPIGSDDDMTFINSALFETIALCSFPDFTRGHCADAFRNFRHAFARKKRRDKGLVLIR